MSKSPATDRQKKDDNSIPVHRTPKWVKVFGIGAVILIFAFIVIHLLGGGFRGHTP